VGELAALFQRFDWFSLIDVAIVALIIFGLFYLVRGTQAAPLLRGVIILGVIFGILGSVATLPAVSWLFGNALPALLIAIPVIFQPELRRALEVLATRHDSQKKVVSLSFNGEGKRKVKVGYVIENPIWKTSYRLKLDRGEAFLQGWAVVENLTGGDWKDVELVLVTDGIVVITCTILINHLLRKLAAFSAIVLGTLVTSLCWIVLALRPSMLGAVISIFILAIGEIIQQPRYYEYISRLAPPEQQGTYMGFAFLPLGIGSLIGGWFGGRVLHYFGEVRGQPELVWYVIIAVGLLTTLLLWIYDRIVKPAREAAVA